MAFHLDLPMDFKLTQSEANSQITVNCKEIAGLRWCFTFFSIASDQKSDQ